MKLIFVNRYFYPDISATSQLLADLAFDQAARGADVHVVTGRQLYEDPAATLPADEEHGGVRIHRIATTRFGRASLIGRAIDYATFYLSAAAKLLALARKGDVIVAKTDPPLVSVVAAWVARRRGARLVNWLQDVFPEVAVELGVKVPMARLARSLRNYSLRSASANVVVGRRMATRLAQLAGGPVPVEVIENWADGRLISPIPRESNPLRTQWNLGDRFVVGYSGNMGRAHEFDTVIEACELLRPEPDIVFLFIGAGRYRGEIEDAARRRSLPAVRFQPYQPREMLAFSLSAADVHLVTLLPALEGLIVPSKFYGIAAAGRPTLFVGDRDGEIAALVERERCGKAIPTGRGGELAAAIRDLRDHPDAAQAMGARARAAFDARFDRPIALERWDRTLRP